jgi:sugar-specific transcriptional regulator TrmB
MNLNILKNIGLTDGEIKVYNTLLESGEMAAGEIIKKTALKRGDCYNKIYDLKKKGLIEEFSKNKKKYFRVNDPNNLDNLINAKYSEIADTKKMLESILPEIESTYNLTYFKPRVNFYEGVDGFKKVLYDTLTAKSVIYTYVDIEAVQKYAKNINARYVQDREKMGKKKKVIAVNSIYNRKYFEKQGGTTTDIKFIDYPLKDFGAAMQIYDNKVSYLIMRDKMISVLIEDSSVAKMHKGLFEFNWKMGKL